MKGKRHTTEDKIRILRAADGGKNIGEVGKEKNISEQTFHDVLAAIGGPQNADLILRRMSVAFHGLGPVFGPD